MGDPRVLHVVTDTDRRGAQLAGALLHDQLTTRGWDSRLVALAPGATGGLEVRALGRRAKSPGTLRALHALMRSADVVVAHGSTTLPVTALAAAGRPPFIYVNIGDPRGWLTTGPRLWRTRAALARAAAVAALSPDVLPTLTNWLRVPADRIRVAPNFRDATLFRPLDDAERTAARAHLGLPPASPVIMWMGALSAEKRPDLALEVARGRPDVLVVVAGGGPLAEDLRQPAREAGVRLVGPVEDPWRWLGAADLCLLTSDTEGVPGVLVEAGLCGLPAVATDVGFVADVVRDGQTGRLVPPADASALLRAVDDCLDARRGWGAAARVHCRATFATDVVVPVWEDLLASVAAGGPGSPWHASPADPRR